MSRVNPGRMAAARVLIAVERGAHAEDLLVEQAPAAGPDRGLAWHLTLGVLRHQGSLDHVLAPLLKKGGLPKLDPAVRVALRMGLFEAALCRTASHAAVDQAVELTKKLRLARASGLVNAVLRRAIKVPFPTDPFVDLPDWLRVRWAAHPQWVKRIQQPAVVCVATTDQQPPEMPSTPAQANGEVVSGIFEVTESGSVSQWPGFDAGRWWVMDPAAAAVADLCEARPGMRILDACAAPGGKSFRLHSQGASVMAVDADEKRLLRLKENAQRLGVSVETALHDWTSGPMDDTRFDVVVVDAPCTGLGVIRRHPEIRWRRLQSDPAAMAFRQRRILQACAAHVRPGGRLVYAVCSPMEEEGEGVVNHLSGWSVTRRWSTVPPQHNEDAFQGFVLERS